MTTTIGEVRQALAEQQDLDLENLVNKHKKHRLPYYIMLFVKDCPLTGRLRKTYIVLKTKADKFKPFPYIGTQCWRVDNRNGQITKLWNLPRDIPCVNGILVDEQRALSDEILTSVDKYNMHAAIK